ncbi:septation protein SepH [Bailinhaonella thermotolerans]|uniref:DUF3071 domain-containing protein n=1 Tax=Bailinhaonella thermotolerans TaxID=1070861 RepID=A0A3A4AWH3_9ACTN|nr:septation protein SepH [Bailinhaonella thermotolerans]RJL34265.1 DUF3071 domain-containing protein [Bailinhaonella thermotolerans]
MQELRLVAVSEDGTYLVLATAGRGTRFTLPVDDRLRAAVRGNFSRLGQYEIEVESPLRPKEIQARIRAGETAEEIAATAGIPVERVRWFEGPVLQEREYMAQQAQRVPIRFPGASTPGPALGELVAERLGRTGVPAEEIDWDSRKLDDGTWRVKLGFIAEGQTRHAEWVFDPRRRHLAPADDTAGKLTAEEFDGSFLEDETVTRFAPRLAAKLQPVPPLQPVPAAPLREEPPATEPPRVSDPIADAMQVVAEPAPEPVPDPVPHPAPPADEPARPAMVIEDPVPLSRPRPHMPPPALHEEPAPAPKITPAPAPAAQPKPAQPKPAAPAASAKPVTPVASPPPADKPAPKPAAKPAKPQAAPAASAKPAPAKPKPAPEEPAEEAQAAETDQKDQKDQPQQPQQARPARKAAGGRGRRASVPTWDEIMFGARRQD